MAITINSLPSFTPSFNDNYIVATSTNSAEPNFRLNLKVEVYNGSTYDLAFEALVPQRPDGNIIYNLKSVLRDITRQSIGNVLQAFTFEGNEGINQIKISVQEYYGDPPSLEGSVSDQVFQTFAGWVSEYNSFDPASFVITDSTSGKWLHKTTSQDARLDQLITLSALVEDYSDGLERIQIKSYTNTGLLITHNLTVSGTTSKFFAFNFKLSGLNLLTSATIITDDVVRVEFQGQTSAGVNKTDIHTINIIRCPNKYDIVTLFFCNIYGAFQSFSMEGRPVERYMGEREHAEFQDGDVSAGDWAKSRIMGGSEAINIERKNRYLLNSGLISVSEFNRLVDILQSYPLAAEINGELFNCILLTSDLTEDAEFPLPSNYQLEIELSKR